MVTPKLENQYLQEKYFLIFKKMTIVNKKVNGVFQKVKITYDSEEYKKLSEGEKILTLKEDMWIDEDKTLAELELEKEKQKEKEEIVKEFQEYLSSIISKYTEEERQTWELKVREAEKVKAGETSEFINSLLIEWETAQELAEKILKNAQDYQKIYCEAERKMREKLKALEN